MSFNPGVHMSYTTQLPRMATGAMMVPVTPVRQVALVPVSTVVVGAPHIQTAPLQITSTRTFTQAKPVINIQNSSSDSKNDGSQVVTVFVGNITERASDTLVRQILMKCGTIYAWKRVQGASGKLQAFGFCEYKEPEAALRAISLLHDFKLGDKKLLVKVDSKTQELIDVWKKKNAKTSNYIPGMVDARSALEVLLREYHVELNTPVASESLEAPKKKEYPLVRESVNVEENLQELDLEKDQKDYISKEIRSFREAQKVASLSRCSDQED